MSTKAAREGAEAGRTGVERLRDDAGELLAPTAPAADRRAAAAGALDLVARQRPAVEALLRRHGVAPAEAPALIAEALLAVAGEERPAPAAAAAPGGRLLRALEIACARRDPQEEESRGREAARSHAGAAATHRPAAAPVALDARFAARLAAALPESPLPNAVPRNDGRRPMAIDPRLPEESDCGASPRRPPRSGTAGGDFAALLRAVSSRLHRLHRRLAADRRAAPRRAARAVARPEDADPAAIASRGVAEHLLGEAAAAWVEDAHRARNLARLALSVVRRLDGAREGAAALADLEARALATLGNAERVVGDLAAADAALAEAGRVLAGGSRDPRLRADLLRLAANLRRAQGRPADALRLLDQAAAIYRWLGDTHAAGRLLLQRAAIVEAEDPRQAAALALRALDAIDLGREPRLELVALHNLLLYRHRAGDLDQAAALLPRVTAAAERLGGRLDRLRLRWLAAQIAADAGDEAAEPELAAVRDAFLGEAMPLDALLAALELAAHRLARGRAADTRQLAEELIPLASSRPLDRATLATLLLFQQAARRDRADLALVRSTAAALRRAGDRASGPPLAS